MCALKTNKPQNNSVTDFSYCLGLFKQMGMTNTDKYNTNYNNLQYMRTADKKCAPQFWNYNGILFFSNLTPVSVAPYQWIKFGMHTFLKNYDNFEAELIASSDWNRDHIPRQTDQFYFLGHWQRKWSRKWDLEWWCRLAAVFTKRCKITELKTKPDPVADNNWVSQFVFRKWCCMHCSNQLKKKKKCEWQTHWMFPFSHTIMATFLCV